MSISHTSLLSLSLTCGFFATALSAQPSAESSPSVTACACACMHASSDLTPLELPYPHWNALDSQATVEDIRVEYNQNKKKIEQITAVPDSEMCFENTFGALESCDTRVDTLARGLYHMSAVGDTPQIRKDLETMQQLSTEFGNWIIANPALWETLKTAAAQDWVKELSPSKKKYVEDTLRSFKLSGADLPAEKKAEIGELRKELSTLGIQFSKNVLDSTNAWEKLISDPAQLAGMSDAWMKSRAAMALEKGHGTAEKPQWLLGQDDACLIPVLDMCDVEATRRLIWEGLNTVGAVAPYDNAELIEAIVAKRQEIAQLLGFDNYAQMATAERMVKNEVAAMKFIDDFTAQLKPHWEKEKAALLAFVSEEQGRKVTALSPWDVRYYRTKLREKQYAFDSESMRPYFPADKAIAGSLDIFEKLFSVTITQLPTSCKKDGKNTHDIWDTEVTLYQVVDNATKAHLGSFYLDLYPRSNKRAGAWCMGLRPGDPAADGKPHSPHLAVVVGNFTPPADGKPALFSEYEMTVLLHELGHLFHQMLSDVELRSHTGTAVARDFVEMPSQLMEFWLTDKDILPMLSGHYETGEAMPEDMMDKYLASRFFMPADSNMRQLGLAKLDMEIYSNFDSNFKGQDIDKATYNVQKAYMIPVTLPARSMVRQFSHIMSGGYGAGYYSYKWAEVLSADAYTRFKAEGMLNPKTGGDLRRSIMSQGGSKDEAEQFRNFMGREPKADALLESQGLK